MRAFILVLATGLSMAPAALASAQVTDDPAAALVRAKRQAVLATARAALLEQQAAAAIEDADRARREQAAVAERVHAAEADIVAARARIAIVEGLRRRQRVRLAAKQQPIVRLAGALQVMARRPPALALVQPGTLNDVIHVRALLASSLPLVRARTAGIRAEIAEGDRLRTRAALALATLRAGERKLRDERAALVRLEGAHRLRSAQLAESAVYEQDRAMALGEQARDIVDLMQQLEAEADVRARLVRLPAPMPRPDLPSLSGQAAPVPARPGDMYRLPVAGRLVRGLGEVQDSGVRSKGLTFAVDPGATVIAPGAGRVAFAGPFRSYGRIVVIDHGRGWMTLLTDMSVLDVVQGDTIAAGAAVGNARGGDPHVTVELRRNGRAVDIPSLLAAG